MTEPAKEGNTARVLREAAELMNPEAYFPPDARSTAQGACTLIYAALLLLADEPYSPNAARAGRMLSTALAYAARARDISPGKEILEGV